MRKCYIILILCIYNVVPTKSFMYNSNVLSPIYKHRNNNQLAMKLDIDFNKSKKSLYNKFIRKNKYIPKIIRYFIHHKFSLKDSELKHGRIAMLAVLGRICAETIHPVLALKLYSENLLVNSELVPSLFNGGLSKINCIFYILTFIYIFINELNHLINITDITSSHSMKNITVADNIITDNPNTNELKRIELEFGRIAMLLSVWFCYYEYTTKTSIINAELLAIYPWFVMFVFILVFT
jgi:hypothetical protein